MLALVTSLVTYKRFYDTPLGFFPLLIAYTFFNELLGFLVINFEAFSFFEETENDWHNVVIYNIYSLFFYGYLYWVYHGVLKSKKHRKLVKVFAIITYVGYAVSLLFQDPFHSDLYYAECLNSILINTLIVIHFRKLKKLNVVQPSKYNLMVWFNAGMFLFHLYYPFYLLNGYLNVDFFLTYELRKILWIVVSIMYLLFTVGFLLNKRRAFA
ncbi:hypothetical protein GCM10011414_21440 [Croceivirga lutea]|nr:hypothetical protein GCM10011414_21440 [Croceivirga lutea]